MFQRLSLLINTVSSLKLSFETLKNDEKVLKSIQDTVLPLEPLVLEIEETYKNYPGTVENQQVIVDSINLLREIRVIVIEGHNFKKEEPKSMFSFFSTKSKSDNTLHEEYMSRVNEKKTALEVLTELIKTSKETSTL